MNLCLSAQSASSYKSRSQQIRVMTETWVGESIYCPSCGNPRLSSQKNNSPVLDFYCETCHEAYELKSKKDSFGKKIVDGAYSTMISRLSDFNNPSFFFLNYEDCSLQVKNFIVIPKHFFVPEIIEQRKPLSENARRAGWVGCNILLDSIPESGKVYFIRNGLVTPQENVLSKWKKTLFLREEKEISAKGWLLDVMRCVEKNGREDFTLQDVYQFEGELSVLHSENKHIKDKIRQQLQILRDKNHLEFVSRGKYRLI